MQQHMWDGMLLTFTLYCIGVTLTFHTVAIYISKLSGVLCY